MRNGKNGRVKSNLQVIPTPKGNSPVQVPIHEDLKHGTAGQLTLQNMAKKESMEGRVSAVEKRMHSAAKSDNLSVASG